jgi:hypothetical protein
MTPKELADNESTIKIDNDDVLMILIDGPDAWDYYVPQRLKDKWAHFRQRKNYVHLVLDKNGDDYYVITSSSNFSNHTVVDSNDRYVSIQVVADAYPSIESELFDFFDVDTIYSVLKRIKGGKKYDRWDLRRIDENISNIEFNQRLPSKSMIKLSFFVSDFIKYFDVGDENEHVINAIYSYGGYDFTDDDRIWGDWREGYFYGNFNDENEKLIKEIISFISPDILFLEDDEFNEKALEVLFDKFSTECNNIMGEFVSLANKRANEIIKAEIEEDFSDVFNDTGIIQSEFGEEYYTTVNVLLSLYEDNNNKTDTIAELIEKLAEKTNVSTTNYWEHGSDEAFVGGEYGTKFQQYAKSELEDILEYIENNPEEFERFKEYRNVLFNLKKLGYEVGWKYPLPRNTKNSFKIYSINKDNGRIKLGHLGEKGEEDRTYSFEEFKDYLHTPELFEHLIRKFKK